MIVRSAISHPIQSVLSLRSDLTHIDTLYCCLTSAKPPLLPASHHCASFYCSFLVFMDNFCLPCRPLFFVFLFNLPLSIFPSSSAFFFSPCGMLDYGGVFAIILLSDEVMQGLLSPSFCHRNSLQGHICASSHT